jgi:hypothetical protein
MIFSFYKCLFNRLNFKPHSGSDKYIVLSNKVFKLFGVNPLIKIIFYGMLISISSNFLVAQSVKEKSFKELRFKIEEKSKQLSVLEERLNEKVKEINTKKSAQDFDEEELKELFSSTSQLTNFIEKIQLELNKLNNQLELIKLELYKIYSTQIDSINRTEIDVTKKSKLTTDLIEKRLSVSAKIDILSFNPEKVLNIEKSKNKIGEKVYTEFLNSAYDEVNGKLSEITILKEEIRTIITLNEETKTFLEEADFDNDISYFSSNTSRSSNSDGERSLSASFSDAENTLDSQTKSFSNILTQLNVSEFNKNQTYSLENISKNKDLNEFKVLIDKVEQQLKDYKVILDHKINNQ